MYSTHVFSFPKNLLLTADSGGAISCLYHVTMNYNERLDKLFDKWRQRSIENNEAKDSKGNVIFTADGLMKKNDDTIDVEKEWSESPKRIMFLLKDQPSEWSDDTRLWLKDNEDEERNLRVEGNRNLKPRFIRNIANVFYGLSNARTADDCWLKAIPEEDIREHFNTRPFAFVECKKQGGTTSIDDKELKTYLERYGDLLREEIEILNPNIFVCSSHLIYAFVIDMFNKDELLTIPEHNSIRVHQPSGTIILCSYHPSARMNYEDFYEGVMWHYRAYLRYMAENNKS